LTFGRAPQLETIGVDTGDLRQQGEDGTAGPVQATRSNGETF
jgi:hypothetical protein